MEDLKIGDVVIHKTQSRRTDSLKMTVHGFNDNYSNGIDVNEPYETGTYVITKWYDVGSGDFKVSKFRPSELIKMEGF